MFMKRVIYSAMCIAIALILSRVKLFALPQGGDVTACSMLFICLIGYWFGSAAGVLCGAAYGLLHLVLGAYIVHPAQLLLDYPIAFGMLGLSGLFRKTKYGIYKGYIFGVSLRLVCSFISGVIFFSEYAPEGVNLLIYSAAYNASYMLPEMAITLLIMTVPAFNSAIKSIAV